MVTGSFRHRIHLGWLPFYQIDKEHYILSNVELIGVEPTTSALQGRRSPN